MSPQILPSTSGASPFDAIKRTRPDGTEYWSARGLMEAEKYSRWEKFKTGLSRAMTTARNQGHHVEDHFPRSVQKVAIGSGATRDREDYHLSRFAAYLVAMNGDPNMPEVAAAQAYFAVRTREAETTRPALTDDEIVAQALAITTHRVRELESVVEDLKPDARAWRQLADADGNYGVGDAAKILSQDAGISVGRNRLFTLMEDAKWIYRRKGPRGGWCAYQTQVECGRLHERPATPFLNRKTGEYELPAPTIRITVKGVADLHAKLSGGQLAIGGVA
ncbi:phage antirepressor KilAC domain-containing protein [Tomitella cavernea]|uniref:phage antirepressor KilAC domain-containing protein n=1 Tax=Tomitella cavernea TaxID=1387982 RepID=UPI001907CFBC|nr:phage antirepressor KilAC domain-containing protein [Tomitella cavernea]